MVSFAPETTVKVTRYSLEISTLGVDDAVDICPSGWKDKVKQGGRYVLDSN